MSGIVNSTGAVSGVVGTTVGTPVGGITEADYWRLATQFTGSAEPVGGGTGTLERCDTDGFGLIGTGMTESSGIFSFPSTGYWNVVYITSVSLGGDTRFIHQTIQVSTNSGGAWSVASENYSFIKYTSSSTTYSNATCSCIIDVTSVSTVLVKFDASPLNSSVSFRGNTERNTTGFQFLRLGDT